MEGDVLLVLVVVVALGFDFTNGFHDTANAVATSISTRALSPRLAVAVAAVANLAGAFVTTAVAKTVGKGIIDTGLANEKTVLAALIGAVVWNLLTWWLGLPTSSSHALIGGFVGAGLTAVGPSAIIVSGITKVAWFIVLSPLFGLVLGWLGMLFVMWLFRSSTPSSVGVGSTRRLSAVKWGVAGRIVWAWVLTMPAAGLVAAAAFAAVRMVKG